MSNNGFSFNHWLSPASGTHFRIGGEMKRVIIVGGGVSGLVCSHAFKKHKGLDVKVLEPSTPGGEFLAGGLKYIHHTEAMTEMFDELDVLHSNYTVQGGILLRGKVQPYPKCFMEMDKGEARRIQADHYRKTRRAEPDDRIAKQAMNDPAAAKPRRALRCHFPEMIEQLAAKADIVPVGLVKVEADHILVSGDRKMPYDYLVMTIPLWIIRQCVSFYVPEGMAMKLNVALVIPSQDSYARWDYVYTPYTPADSIHRISPSGEHYSVETNGDLDNTALASDLNFIFKHGWSIESLREGLKGHLLELERQPNWPENIAPLGRFARWDSRATTDVTLDNATELARRWFG